MFNADNEEMFLTMYSDMRTAKASMLQDLEKGKPTEVRMIGMATTSARPATSTASKPLLTTRWWRLSPRLKVLPRPWDKRANLFDRKLFDYELYHV